jgi:hypothetical protein
MHLKVVWKDVAQLAKYTRDNFPVAAAAVGTRPLKLVPIMKRIRPTTKAAA